MAFLRGAVGAYVNFCTLLLHLALIRALLMLDFSTESLDFAQWTPTGAKLGQEWGVAHTYIHVCRRFTDGT
jgi:hypothetical protein